MQEGNEREERSDESIPDHLKHWPGLYVREGDQIIEAPAEDRALARKYPQWPNKGEIVDGMRITIMTRSSTYQLGEEVRVIHVVEVVEPGREVYVMGPKPIYGEYVDGQRATELLPKGHDPLVPAIYDGAILTSPAVDYNYDITTYTFLRTGSHQIYWKIDSLQSKVLTLQIVGGANS